MPTLTSVFVGVPQSRYAALAILCAIAFVSFTILVGKEPIPMSQKFGFVLLIFLISLPSIAMSLFQLTCLVTGAGFKNQRWWCSLYAWLVTAMIVFYAVLLIVAGVMSLTAPKVVAESKPVDINEANKAVERFFAEQEKESTYGNSDMAVMMPPKHLLDQQQSQPPSPFTVRGSHDEQAPFGGMVAPADKGLSKLPMAANGSTSGSPLMEGFYSPAATSSTATPPLFVPPVKHEPKTQAECDAVKGTWDAKSNTCVEGFYTGATTKAECDTKHGVWNPALNTCSN
jgi:hypothetical protein